MIGASKAAILGASNSRQIEYGWQTGIPNHAVSTIAGPDDTMTATPGGAWGTVGLASYPIVGGLVSIDIKILAVSSPNRLGVGVSRFSDVTSFCANAIYSSTDPAKGEGVVVDPVSVNDTITIELNYSTGALDVRKNDVAVGTTQTITPGGVTWYFCMDEFEDSPSWQLVPEVYAPRSGYTKINP